MTEIDLYYRQSIIALISIVLVLAFVIVVVVACAVLSAPIWLILWD